MKIVLVILMLMSLLGCSSKEIVQKAVLERQDVVEQAVSEVPEEPESGTPDEEIGEEPEEVTETVSQQDLVLEEAAEFAECEDYASAIHLLEDAMEQEGELPAYRDAHAEYCEAYREWTIARAEAEAAMGNYLTAIQIINETTAVIGTDEELSGMAQGYAQTHVETAREETASEQEAVETETVPQETETPVEAVTPEQTEETTQQETETTQTIELTPFYGIWCYATKDLSDAEQAVAVLEEHGLGGEIFITTDWSNLNQNESWYVVTAGLYPWEADANVMLDSVREVYPDAYVKYSGERKN